jgi:dihydropyrimidinase
MLIRNGTVVTAGGQSSADILINDGKVEQVRPGIQAAGEEVVDATGMLVLPGLVDPHTHLLLDTGTARTVDDFSSGSASAAAGGVTTYIDFANQPKGKNFRQALEARLKQVEGQSHVDYAIHLNITNLPEGWESDLDELVRLGVTSAKIYTTYKGTVFYCDDWTWFRLMQRSGEAGFLVMVHAENDDILEGKKQELLRAGKTSLAYHAEARPAVAEAEAVNRGLFFSRVTGSPVYFVHLSNPLSIDLIAEARRAAVKAIVETCPHFLVLDDSVYAGGQASRYVMTPPLRDKEVQAKLWERLEGGQVQSIGSDHCGFSLSQRQGVTDFTEISPGIPGVETTLLLMYTFGVRRNRIDLSHMVRLLSANPARIFGLWPDKGDLAPGFDGDAVIFDPRPERALSAGELHSRAGYSPYEGMTLQGRVKTTICRGQVVYRDGQVVGKPGLGRFLKCRPFDRELEL